MAKPLVTSRESLETFALATLRYRVESLGEYLRQAPTSYV